LREAKRRLALESSFGTNSIIKFFAALAKSSTIQEKGKLLAIARWWTKARHIAKSNEDLFINAGLSQLSQPIAGLGFVRLTIKGKRYLSLHFFWILNASSIANSSMSLATVNIFFCEAKRLKIPLFAPASQTDFGLVFAIQSETIFDLYLKARSE